MLHWINSHYFRIDRLNDDGMIFAKIYKQFWDRTMIQSILAIDDSIWDLELQNFWYE